MATSRPIDPRRVDVAAVSVVGAQLEGSWPLAGFVRLSSATLPAAADAAVDWRARVERAALEGAGVRPSLALEARAGVRLECQRCLQAMLLPLNVVRRFFFVDGEAAAAALDADSDDDVLASTPSLDLHLLLEDELLLALPVVPRHDVCSKPLPLATDSATGSDEREHPFAALAALRRGPRLN